jgi:hypothetical protein
LFFSLRSLQDWQSSPVIHSSRLQTITVKSGDDRERTYGLNDASWCVLPPCLVFFVILGTLSPFCSALFYLISCLNADSPRTPMPVCTGVRMPGSFGDDDDEGGLDQLVLGIGKLVL